jgi:2-C-methyl-D-erythritol 2,4-cyclodiphosphate synthase
MGGTMQFAESFQVAVGIKGELPLRSFVHAALPAAGTIFSPDYSYRFTERAKRGKVNMVRIGQGFDVHQLAEGRKLIIGGVVIPYEKGLLGHSDADVLLHAICDALLGAAALGDIGRHFSDTDPRFKNIDSRILLHNVYRLLEEHGYRVVNIDATIIAQAPKMAPHISAMITNIAQDLRMRTGDINIKAKTAERLGPVGRGEGIEAEAVCLITRIDANN